MLAAVRELDDVDLSDVEAAIGSQSFQRGRSYVRANSVVAIEWDEDAEALTGKVLGQGGLYNTAAFFDADPDGPVVFEEGVCSCPVGHNCKHVAAIVIAASAGTGVGRASSRRPSLRIATDPQLPSWERPLRALIDVPAAHEQGTPLAIELALSVDGGPGRRSPRLTARLMRPGARGGWVNGSLTWGGLDSWHVRSGGYRSDHLALIQELYAALHARTGSNYYYRYSGDKSIDLSEFESSQLWSLLTEADRLGLALIHARSGLGEVRRYQRGELVIDVTRESDGGSVATAAIRVDGGDADDIEPLLFLGSTGVMDDADLFSSAVTAEDIRGLLG